MSGTCAICNGGNLMRVLIHVEDSSAANWIVPLIDVLSDHDLKVIAEGAAGSYLCDRAIAAVE